MNPATRARPTGNGVKPEFYNALLKVNPNCCIELNKDSEGAKDFYESEDFYESN